MKKYTVFYRLGQIIEYVRVTARNARIAAVWVRTQYHCTIITVEG